MRTNHHFQIGSLVSARHTSQRHFVPLTAVSRLLIQ
jgi:hypothetical protein